jgi:hypothetical protein
MSRPSILALISLLAASCAVIPEGEVRLASSGEPELSTELECMCDCLDEGDTTGESCFARCF